MVYPILLSDPRWHCALPFRCANKAVVQASPTLIELRPDHPTDLLSVQTGSIDVGPVSIEAANDNAFTGVVQRKFWSAMAFGLLYLGIVANLLWVTCLGWAGGRLIGVW